MQKNGSFTIEFNRRLKKDIIMKQRVLRGELVRLEQEKAELVSHHIELLDQVAEITEELNDLQAQIDILVFSIEEKGTTKDFTNDNSYLQKFEKI